MRLRLAVSIFCILLVAGSAIAGEKIVVLKNGRKMRGEVADQDASTITLQVEGGEVPIPRDQIDHMEDPPPPDTTFGGTDTQAPAATAPVKTSSTTGKPATSTTSIQPTTAMVSSAASASASSESGALATPQEIESVKNALIAVPAVDPADEEESKAARERAIEDVKEHFPLAVLVAFVAQPTGYPPHAEKELAVDLVVAAGDDARPLIVRAIVAAAKDDQLLDISDVVGRLGDDEKGSFEGAYMKHVSDLAAQKLYPSNLLASLRTFGTRRSLPALEKLLLATDDPNPESAYGYGSLCSTILSGDPDAEADVEPLVTGIKPDALPDLHRLRSIVPLLAWAKGHVPEIKTILEKLDGTVMAEDDDARKRDRDACIQACLDALAAMGTYDARHVLLDRVETLRDERRLAAIRTLARLKVPAEETVDALSAIVNEMERGDMSEAEVGELAKSLEALTGLHTAGTNVPAWRQYIDSLRNPGPENTGQ